MALNDLEKLDQIPEDGWALVNVNGELKLVQLTDLGGLPVVTVDDNGKVLGVSEGQWSTIDPPSGGGGVTYINVTQTADGEPWTTDTTFAEAKALLASGVETKVNVFTGSYHQCTLNIARDGSNDSSTLVWSSIDNVYSNDGVIETFNMYMVTLWNDGRVVVDMGSYGY